MAYDGDLRESDPGDGHTFSLRNPNGNREVWDVPDLWAASEGLPTELVRVSEIPDLELSWLQFLPDLEHPEVAPERYRIERADLSYPILLHPHGGIADGMHRTAKVILRDGWEGVLRAKRFGFDTLPPPRRSYGARQRV